ncbi:DUF4259 domain-containing protein [Streptomyces sp. HUAS TT7]|uniref:DUF4259 domain-containing protein n=1 Tax=Streptomyces sp. HUAS TT7 TaxID=3447507 RepID=UPI003F65EF87
MGTWDVGPFGNDTAADWCNHLDDASAEAREGVIRDTPVRAAGTTDYLDADVAEEAVAAAALAAAQCPGGEPIDSVYGPEHPLPGLTGLSIHALEVLDRVVAEPSELLELWDEWDGTPCRSTINRLRITLHPNRRANSPT